MEILSNTETTPAEEKDEAYGGGDHIQILRCPGCQKVNIVGYYWHESMRDWFDTEFILLYPKNNNIPEGLPASIKKYYEDAIKIKPINSELYAIALRKILELVCIDKKAEGDKLYLKIKYLSEKGEIPEKLIAIAHDLKDFGNAGAHGEVGIISDKQIPIAESLCRAILEYVYGAPYLATLAADKFKKYKSPRKGKEQI